MGCFTAGLISQTNQVSSAGHDAFTRAQTIDNGHQIASSRPSSNRTLFKVLPVCLHIHHASTILIDERASRNAPAYFLPGGGVGQ